MTKTEFYAYKQHALDAFSKTVIRNESASIFRSITRQSMREISFSEISDQTLMSFQTTDTYQPEATFFYVRGYRIPITDWALAQALQGLHPFKRDVILLSYFLEKSDPQIGKILNTSASTINYRRLNALKHLKRDMEVLNNESH